MTFKESIRKNKLFIQKDILNKDAYAVLFGLLVGQYFTHFNFDLSAFKIPQ